MRLYGEFLKIANEYVDMDQVPPYVARAAYNVYNALPEKSAALIMAAYDNQTNEMAKVAFEMIAANIVKEAGLPGLAFRAAFSNPGMVGVNAAIGATKKPRTLIQSERKEVLRDASES
jgi:hypothetical protein